MEQSNLLGIIVLIAIFGGAALLLYTSRVKKQALERKYREALIELRRNPQSPESRLNASQRGTAYYGAFNSDGKPSVFERSQIAKEIQEATAEAVNQNKKSRAVSTSGTIREVSEYRNIR